MKTPRLGRRKFLSGMAGSAAFLSALPRTARASTAQAVTPAPAPPRIKFAVIGINHSHIYSQVEAVQRGGGELVRVVCNRAGPCRRVPETVSPGEARADGERDPRRSVDPADSELGDPRRTRTARHPRHAAREGLHVRQAGHHDARAAGGGAAGAGADPAHLLDHVQRALRESRDGQGRRAGQGWCDWPGDPDHRTRAPPHDAGVTAAVVFRTPAIWRHPLRHRLAPGRPVPLLHRIDRRLLSSPRRSATSTTRSTRRSKISATSSCAATTELGTSGSTGSRPMALRPGATAASRSSARTGSSKCARTSISPAGPAPATCSSSTARTPAISTAARRRCPMASNSSRTFSTGRRPPCRRRTAFSPPS